MSIPILDLSSLDRWLRATIAEYIWSDDPDNDPFAVE